MKKIIGFFPKIEWIPGADNLEYEAQDKVISNLKRSYEKEHPEDFIYGVVRDLGQTVYAIPRSELKPMSELEYYHYRMRKGIWTEDDVPDGCHMSIGSSGLSVVENRKNS